MSLLLAAGLAAGLGIAIFRSAGGGGEGSQDTVLVLGYTGSEKVPFLTDPEVTARLAELGFELDARPAGSRQIAEEVELADLDFAFPGSAPAAERIAALRPPVATIVPFSSPMVMASWTANTDALATAGVATDEGGWWRLDLAAYLDLVDAGTRWSDLGLPSDRQILTATTDLRRSNSAEMYLALIAYIRNGNSIVTDRATADSLLPTLSPHFLAQGYTASSSQSPFDNYLVRGAGAVPLVFVYEAQFVAEAAKEPSSITDGMELLYPAPTVFTNHTFLAFTEGGQALGEALDTDPELLRLATRYGFRTDATSLQDLAAERDLPIPATVAEVTDPPSYEILEYLISAIAEEYEQ